MRAAIIPKPTTPRTDIELERHILCHETEEFKWKYRAAQRRGDMNSNTKKRLLQSAISYAHPNVAEYLLKNGCDVNAKDASGETPLLTALRSDRIDMVKLLLNSDADVRAKNRHNYRNKSALELLMGMKKWKGDIVNHVIDNLKRSRIHTKTMVELLARAKCPFVYSMKLRNVELHERCRKRHSSENIKYEMMRAVREMDFNDIEWMLRYGHKSGKLIFYKLLFVHRIKPWDVFVKHLSSWEVLTEEALAPLLSTMKTASQKQLQLLLNCKINVEVWEKFDVDIRLYMFGNKRLESLSKLMTEDFDVNAVGFRQRTALHCAVQSELQKNVKFLLNSGADANALDDQGQTPLFFCKHQNKMIISLLLAHRADVQITNNEGMSLFGFAMNKNTILLHYLLAHLAIIKSEGLSIEQEIQREINFDYDYECIFRELNEQVERLKANKIIPTASFFDLLIHPAQDKIERFDRSLCTHGNPLFLLRKYKYLRDLHSSYYYVMKIKLKKIWNRFRFMYDIADIMTTRTGTSVNFDSLAVCHITQYLSSVDVNNFLKSNVEC